MSKATRTVLTLPGRNGDGVAGRLGRRRLRPGRYLAVVRAERVARGAFVDVRQVADENDGPGGERANRVKFLLRDWDSKFIAAWDSPALP